MNPESLHGTFLAASETWSELLSMLLIILFLAVPAIIRTISEAQKRQKERQPLEHEKIQDVSTQKIGHRGLGPAKKGTERPRGPLSEWDRRQQMIRERLNKLQEQAEARVSTPEHRRPQAASKPQAEPVHEGVRPVAQALPQQPERVSQPPRPPVYSPQKPAPTRPPEKIRQYVQASPSVTVKQQPIPPQRSHKQTKTRLVSPTKKSQERMHPAIEQIVRASNPLRAGIILKEILDQPKSLRFGSDL
jgi:hypothetical protein